MAAVTIRNLDEEVHRAIKRRAVRHGRSTEAEIRAILGDAVLPADRLKMGTAIAEKARALGGMELEIERDRTPVQPADFE